jgi:hypothetical protein
MMLRYVFWLQAGREDVRVILARIVFGEDHRTKLLEHFVSRGDAVFLLEVECPAELAESLREQTPPALAELGFLQVSAGSAARSTLP